MGRKTRRVPEGPSRRQRINDPLLTHVVLYGAFLVLRPLLTAVIARTRCAQAIRLPARHRPHRAVARRGGAERVSGGSGEGSGAATRAHWVPARTWEGGQSERGTRARKGEAEKETRAGDESAESATIHEGKEARERAMTFGAW